MTAAGRPRSSIEQIKHLPEIVLYLIQQDNKPQNKKMIAEAVGVNYHQCVVIINKATKANILRQVKAPVKGAGVWYVSNITSMKQFEQRFDVEVEREQRNEVTLLTITKGKLEEVDAIPLNKNISIDGHPITKWMDSLSKHPESGAKAIENSKAFAQVLAELADIMYMGGKGKDAALRTQLRLDNAYEILLKKIEYYKEALNRLKQLAENPILWNQHFCRRSYYDMIEVNPSAEQLQQIAQLMWNHYGRLEDADS